MIINITTKDNKTLKQVRSLSRKKDRYLNNLYFVEGVRIAKEAVEHCFDDIKYIITSESYADKNSDFINQLDQDGKSIYTTRDSFFSDICDTETPQGIAVVLNMKKNVVPDYKNLSFILILDGISEPGNLGTIIRTSEAAGVDAIIMTKGCTDLYNPKVVRSTMGSIFRMPCIQETDTSFINTLKDNGFTIVATALENSVPMNQAEISGKRALVIGSEATGVSEAILSLSDIKIRIPMEGRVESLNAAVAAGISMYFLRS